MYNSASPQIGSPMPRICGPSSYQSPASSLHQQDDAGSIAQRPAFLFGSTRRRAAVTANLGTPSSPERQEASFRSRGVHWSPALVQTKTISPTKVSADDGRQAHADGDRLKSSSLNTSNAPPLRSLRDGSLAEPSPKRMVRRADSMPAGGTPAALAARRRIAAEASELPAEDNASDHWVTVFGFAPGDATDVLRYFSRHANIVKHQFGPAGSNWVLIRYSCALHAQQALSLNARLVRPNLRIGVTVLDNDADILRGEQSLREQSFVAERTVGDENASQDNGVGDLNDETRGNRGGTTGPISRSVDLNRSANVSIADTSTASAVTGGRRRSLRPLSLAPAALQSPSQPHDTSLLGKLWNNIF